MDLYLQVVTFDIRIGEYIKVLKRYDPSKIGGFIKNR